MKNFSTHAHTHMETLTFIRHSPQLSMNEFWAFFPFAALRTQHVRLGVNDVCSDVSSPDKLWSLRMKDDCQCFRSLLTTIKLFNLICLFFLFTTSSTSPSFAAPTGRMMTTLVLEKTTTTTTSKTPKSSWIFKKFHYAKHSEIFAELVSRNVVLLIV